MLFFIAFLVFFLIIGVNWWFGAWNCLLNLMNFFLAALVASSFYENVSAQITGFDSTYILIADFVSVWLLFVVVFVMLRLITDLLSRYQMKLDPWLDYTARGVFSAWLAGAFLCFAFFTLQMAPLPPGSLPSDPASPTLGIGPERAWLSFIQSRSRGALSESKQSSLFPAYTLIDHPDDANLNARVFDPGATFLFDNQSRRNRISNNKYLRTGE